MSRTQNAIKNFMVGIVGQILTIVLGFASRSLFLMVLSVDYLGVSGLFSNIITLLSFAELGVGTAIVYSLYKPLAENDEKKILALMNLFKRTYQVIGLTVLVAGLALVPFLDFFVPDRKGIEHLEWMFVLYIVNTSSSYFFSYNRNLITASQKAYKLYKIDFTFKIIAIVLPITGLLITKNYFVFLVLQIVATIAQNLFVYKKVQKQFPILKSHEKPKLDPEVRKQIIKNISALLIYRIASVITAGTDNILLSRFFGLTIVGIYSNYHMIIGYVTTVISQGTTAVTASIGNLVTTQDNEKKHVVFNIMFFINFWIYSFATVSFLLLFTPFISLWLGRAYTLDLWIVIPICFSTYQMGLQGPTASFRDAEGIYWQGKLRPLAQAISNVALSLLLIWLTGSVSAIFWGTILSRLITVVWFDPYIVHKYSLHKPLAPYFKKYTLYILLTIAISALCLYLGSLIHTSLLVEFILKVILCAIVPNAIIACVFCRTEEFKYVFRIVKMSVGHICQKITGHKGRTHN